MFRDSILVCRMHDCYCMIHKVFIRIQSKCGKIRTRKAPNMDIFTTVTNILKTEVIKYKSSRLIHAFLKIFDVSLLPKEHHQN